MNRRTASRPGGSWRWGIPALLLLAPFVLWPLGVLLWRAAAPHDVLSGAVLRDMAGDRFYWGRLGFTAGEAAASLALAALVGLPASYVFASLRFPARGPLRLLVELPLLLPTLVVALAFRELLGPHGWVNDALARLGLRPVAAVGTVWIILAAHVFFGVAVFVRVVGAAWARLDLSTIEAARVLGADRRRRFRYVMLPAIAPAVRAASAIVFLFAFTSFAIVLLLGRPGLETLEVVIFRSATRATDLPQTALLALVQVAALAAALLVFAGGGASHAAGAPPGVVRRRRAPRFREATRAQRVLVLAVVLVLVPLLVAPLAALVRGAFSAGDAGALTTANFTRLFDAAGTTTAAIAPVDAIRWSAIFAGGAAAIAAVAGTAAGVAIARARGRGGAVLVGLLRLPLALPAVALAFAFLLTFHQGWHDLRGSPWLVLLAQALVAYPFVVRGVLATQRTLDPRLSEAARMLGGSTWAVWRTVAAPRTARATLAGAVVAAAISLGEFGATSLLQRHEFATVPIAIYEALGQPNPDALGRALALATLLLAACALAFLVAERLRAGAAEEL